MQLTTHFTRRRWGVLAAVATLAILFLAAPRPAAAQIDIKDWFILTTDTQWHYTGDWNGNPTPSTDDDFWWIVLDTKIQVGATTWATRIQTDADENTDDREMDEDFWYVDAADPDGKLFFYGTHNETADTISTGTATIVLIAQDIILTDPLLLGQNGQQIGDVVTDTGTGTVDITVEVFPIPPVPATVALDLVSTVTYQEMIPVVQTPLGNFHNVLRLIVEISGTASYGGQDFEIDVIGNEFWLKQNLGMVVQDQNADLNDAELQKIDQGQVQGVTIQPDAPNRADGWTLFR